MAKEASHCQKGFPIIVTVLFVNVRNVRPRYGISCQKGLLPAQTDKIYPLYV